MSNAVINTPDANISKEDELSASLEAVTLAITSLKLALPKSSDQSLDGITISEKKILQKFESLSEENLSLISKDINVPKSEIKNLINHLNYIETHIAAKNLTVYKLEKENSFKDMLFPALASVIIAGLIFKLLS